LRSEEYGEESRVPEIKIGTPEQDAYRRDLTINSMFYNINLGIIEDFTG
jgi:tRNA nucleotidyltransferase (CCA-adding enzyme)